MEEILIIKWIFFLLKLSLCMGGSGEGLGIWSFLGVLRDHFGGYSRTIYSMRDRIWVGCVQDKNLNHCILSASILNSQPIYSAL